MGQEEVHYHRVSCDACENTADVNATPEFAIATAQRAGYVRVQLRALEELPGCLPVPACTIWICRLCATRHAQISDSQATVGPQRGRA